MSIAKSIYYILTINMLDGKTFRQMLDKFLISPAGQNARVQIQLPNGQHMDIKEVSLLENKIIGAGETHRLVFVAQPESTRMGKIIGKL